MSRKKAFYSIHLFCIAVVTATEVLIKHFVDEAEGVRKYKAEKKKELMKKEDELRVANVARSFEVENAKLVVDELEKEPHKFPNILVRNPQPLSRLKHSPLSGFRSKYCCGQAGPKEGAHYSYQLLSTNLGPQRHGTAVQIRHVSVYNSG